MAGSVREPDDDESVLLLAEQHNRPTDSAFYQQRIPAWAPILDPVWVIVSFLCIGLIMVPVGYKIDTIQKDVVELETVYDGYEIDNPVCGIGDNYNEGKPCQLTFTAPRDLEPPILIHYGLTNFHQNHRNYFTSYDPYQLRGGDAPSGQLAKAARLDCEPLYKLGDQLLYPCGLTANTMFNDVFKLVGGNDADGNPLEMIEEGIAWASDLQYMFKQREGFRSEPCPDNDTAECCDGTDWSCEVPYLNEKDGLYYRYFYPNDNTTQYLHETYGMTVSPLEGVENEHFIVWMRIAAYKDFRKLYGWINQGVLKGENLTFNVTANYVVTRFRGTKR